MLQKQQRGRCHRHGNPKVIVEFPNLIYPIRAFGSHLEEGGFPNFSSQSKGPVLSNR